MVIKVKTSFLALVLVNVGGVPFAHFTALPQVTPRAVPSAVRMSVKLMARDAVDGVLDMVRVLMFASSVTPNTCAADKSRVNALPEMAGELVVSL